MLREIFYTFWGCFGFKGSVSEKIKVFIALNRINFKAKFIKKPGQIICERFLNYKIYSHTYRNLSYLINEIFLTDDYHFKCSNKTPLILDCGANIGMSILYFKRLFPAAKIMAFEPNPNAFELLKKNVEENNLQDVELYNIALFDKDTEIPFFIDKNAGSLRGSVTQMRGGNNEMLIQAKKLSDILQNTSSIDLIKMDVEGAEINIIKDLHESGALSTPSNYIIEYHHNIENNYHNLSDFLRKFESGGYNYNLKTDFKGLGKFQDVLLYFYKVK